MSKAIFILLEFQVSIMKDKEKILRAFDYLERGKNKIDKERFQESCNILNKYILDAYKEDIITEKEADTFLERLTTLMTGERKTEKYVSGREMKFCQHCGARIYVEAEICPNCGVRVKTIPVYTEKKSSGIAAVLSFLFTGLGQIYNGQIGKGIAFMIIGFILAGTILILIGFILYPLFWIYTIYDAYSTAEKINAGVMGRR